MTDDLDRLFTGLWIAGILGMLYFSAMMIASMVFGPFLLP